jgi:hypothetical protein
MLTNLVHGDVTLRLKIAVSRANQFEVSWPETPWGWQTNTRS